MSTPALTKNPSTDIDYSGTTGDTFYAAFVKVEEALSDLYDGILMGSATDAGILQIGTGSGNAAAGNHGHTGTYQPLDTELTALAGTTSAADRFPYFTGSGTASTLTIVSAIRSVLASADVATMRTNLGLGSAATKDTGTSAGTVAEGDHTHSYQPLDGELTALAGLTSGADKVPYFTGSGTASTFSVVSAIRSVLSSADVATMRSNMGLAIGSNVQAYDAELSALAGLNSSADKFPYFTGSGTADMLTIVSAIRTVLSSADVATMRTAMGLGNSATRDVGTGAGDVAAGNHIHPDGGGSISDPELSALAGLTSTYDSFPYFTGSGTAALLTIVAAIRTVLSAANVPAMRTAMGLGDSATRNVGTGSGDVAVGNHVHSGVYQAEDSELTALAGLTSAADKFPYFTGSGTASLLTIVSAVRTVLASADVPTMRTNLGLAIGTDVQAYDANTMKTNVVTARTRAHRFTPVQVTAASGGALSIDLDLHEECYITLSETTTTVGQPTNQARGKYFVIEITGATGCSLAWNANFLKESATALPTAPANGKRLTVCFRSDGSYMRYIGSQLEA